MSKPRVINDLNNIFNFIETERGFNKCKVPIQWKLAWGFDVEPRDLIIKGDLDLRNSGLTKLPKGLNIGGDLFMYESELTEIPKGLVVKGLMDIRFTPLAKKYNGNTSSLKEQIIKLGGDVTLVYL